MIIHILKIKKKMYMKRYSLDTLNTDSNENVDI